MVVFVFFFQAEDGIRDWSVTGVQTCALPISLWYVVNIARWCAPTLLPLFVIGRKATRWSFVLVPLVALSVVRHKELRYLQAKIGRASCRERGEVGGGFGALSEVCERVRGDKR